MLPVIAAMMHLFLYFDPQRLHYNFSIKSIAVIIVFNSKLM